MLPGFPKTLRVRVLLLVALALVPSVALTLYTAAEQRDLQAEQVLANSMRLARLASADQGRLVDAVRQQLEALSRLPEVRGGYATECTAALVAARQANPTYANLGLLTPDGRLACAALPVTGVDFSERVFFRRVLETGNFSVGEYQVALVVSNASAVTNVPLAPAGERNLSKAGSGGNASAPSATEPAPAPAPALANVTNVTINATLDFGHPVRGPDGRLRSVLFLALDLAWINQKAAEAQLPGGSVLLVVDHRGTVLGRYPEPERWVGRGVAGVPIVQEVLARRQGVVESGDLDGVPRLYAFTPLASPPGAGDVFVAIGIPRATAFAEVDRIFARNLAVMALVGLLAFGLAWVASEVSVVRPVKALAGATKRLSAGELEARSGLRDEGGELGELARAFDEMAGSLQEYVQREQRARRELEEANRRLAQLDTLRTQFINTAAHELATPLTPIRLQLDLLKARRDAPRGGRSLEILDRNVDRLRQLVADLLEVARLQAGRMRVDRRPLALDAVVREAIASFAEPARRGGIALEASLPPGIVVEADEGRLLQVMYNLLSNGLKFTPAGGRVEVALERAGEEAVVRVRDSGIGLRPGDIPLLFQPFTQVHDPARAQSKGSGLGLHISKGIVEVHGGRIWAESPGPGLGATFAFALPLAPRAARPGGRGGAAHRRLPPA